MHTSVTQLCLRTFGTSDAFTQGSLTHQPKLCVVGDGALDVPQDDDETIGGAAQTAALYRLKWGIAFLFEGGDRAVARSEGVTKLPQSFCCAKIQLPRGGSLTHHSESCDVGDRVALSQNRKWHLLYYIIRYYI